MIKQKFNIPYFCYDYTNKIPGETNRKSKQTVNSPFSHCLLFYYIYFILSNKKVSSLNSPGPGPGDTALSAVARSMMMWLEFEFKYQE